MSAAEELTYEQALARLDESLNALEGGKLTLEEAISTVARGREYLQICQRKLDEARRKIESLPVQEEPVADEAPHPASIGELRGLREKQTPGEIPF